MFREGYYLEIIKGKQSAANAVITVKEKTVEMKSKKKITTNKWLSLEDWASLYQVLEKALTQNVQSFQREGSTANKKLTRHLEIVYTVEACENPSDRTSLPTMRVCVSPLKKKSHPRSKDTKKQNSYDSSDKSCNTSSLSSTASSKIMKLQKPSMTGTIVEGHRDVKVEEYIPDAPKTHKPENNNGNGAKIRYIPSRKSALVNLQTSTDSNEYVPAVLNEDLATNSALDTLYIPNSIPKAETSYETYEPSSSVEVESTRTYIPNSQSGRKKIEEYQPDFTSKTMKFDNSYVPSSSAKIKELKKSSRKSSLGSKKLKNRETDSGKTEVSFTKNSNLTHRSIKREI